jgi:hypothetical protein
VIGIERPARVVDRPRERCASAFAMPTIAEGVDGLVGINVIEPVLETIDAGHEHRRERKIRRARQVGATELDPIRSLGLQIFVRMAGRRPNGQG